MTPFLSLYLSLLVCLLLQPASDAFSLSSQKYVRCRSASWRLYSSNSPRPRQSRRDDAQRRQRPNKARQRRAAITNGSRNTTRRVPFDGPALTAAQQCNEETYVPLDLEVALTKEEWTCYSSSSTNDDFIMQHGLLQQQVQPSFQFASLDIILPGLSKRFNSDATFRNTLRRAIRRDVFDATPAYAKLLGTKASQMLLQPDSSLQGSWNQTSLPRVEHVLDQAGLLFMTGDENDNILQRIGALCGGSNDDNNEAPSTTTTTHWIDIVGVQNREISHSWHQDFPMTNRRKTVLWGFPPANQYQGCGVFSHIIPLTKSCYCHPTTISNEEEASMQEQQPILYHSSSLNDNNEQHIVRPMYQPGRELLIYADTDVLHSSPNVACRTSVMRFM